MKFNPLFVVAPFVATLAACSGSSDYDFEAGEAARIEQLAVLNAPEAIFNPAESIVPFPNSLFFVPAGESPPDGTLDIPLAADADQSLGNPLVALNQSDGFSTVAPISTPVSESLDPASLVVGDSIRVFEVSTVQSIAVTGVLGEVVSPFMVASEVDGQLVLIPTVPLKPKTDYLVVLTNGILDMQGDGMEAGLVFNLLKGETPLADPAFEALRGATGTQLAAAQNAGIAPENVALSWVFRTQSTRDVLETVKNSSAPAPLNLGDSLANTATPGIGGMGKANIFVGSIAIPYYQTLVGEDGNPLPALNGFWTNVSGSVVGTIGGSGAPDYAPVAKGTEIVPVLMSVPNENSVTLGNMPANGWPVTVFQHGITRNRTDMLAIADAMADAGRVVIAMDMPMHGLTDLTNPFHSANAAIFGAHERTLDIDAVTQVDGVTTAPGPDGTIDSSGEHFYNPANLANSRDNLRQAVADLFVLTASLSSASVQGVQLDTSNLNFVGHSLGGIVGTTMLAFEPSYQSATIAMSGGGIAQLLANSETFGPTLDAGLAAAGVEVGSAAYNQFFVAAQTLVDSGDPINHAASVAAAGNTSIHFIEVIGDTVIPNAVATAPLSGTEPLARVLGLSQISESAASGGLVKFSAGNHGSILSPVASLAATVEMQIQMATFAATQGTQLPITNASVIQAVE